MRLNGTESWTFKVESILKETQNKIEAENKIRKLFLKHISNRKLIDLLDEPDFLWELVCNFYESKEKGMLKVNTPWLEGKLINKLKHKQRHKRIGVTLQLTQEELNMFSESYNPYDQFEVYEYIAKTYGENWAKYIVSQEITRDELMELEGISRATFFRRTKEIKNEQ